MTWGGVAKPTVMPRGVTPVQRWTFPFFRARLSGTLDRKRNLFYLHTVFGKVKHIDLLFRRTNVH